MSISKESFRGFVTDVQTGTNVTVRFVDGTLRRRSGTAVVGATDGTYRFDGAKRGRGKGGSLLMVLSAADGTTFEFGTPELAGVVSIEAGDSRIGYSSQSEMPGSHSPRPEMASSIKQVLSALMPISPGASRPVIRMTSANPRLNGDFFVLSARKHVGRHGQISAMIQRSESGDTAFEFFSYRDSGEISAIARVS